MILKRNNSRQIIKFILGAILLCFISIAFTTHPTSAVKKQTIKASQLKVLGTYSLSPSTQGATVTQDYFIYTKWSCNSCKTSLVGCKRSKPSSCKTLASGYWGHASSVYHKWGTDTVQILDSGGARSWCINYKTGKKVSSCDKISPAGLTRASWTNALQGYTKYGDYWIRGWGYIKWTGKACELRVYKKNSKGNPSLNAVYYLPTSGSKQVYEIEGVGVDGGTGNVIFTAKSQGKLKFFEVSSAVLNLGGDGSGSSEKRTAKKSAARKKDKTNNTNNYTPSVSTYDGVVDTIFFGTIQDDGEGCGVYTVLDLIMTILTIGIGIAATIGITVSGITYLTAGGNLAKTTKAKRRIYEIVIGLAVYAVIWALLTFLLPEFNPELKACKTLTAEEIAAREASKSASTAKSNTNTNSTASNTTKPSVNNECMSKALPEIRNTICQISSASERVAKTAELLAIPYGKNASQKRFTKPNKWSQISGAKPPKYFQNAYDKYRKGHWKLYSKKFGNVTRVGASCDVFVSTVLKSTGYTNPKGYTHGAIRSKLKDKNKWKVVKSAKRGDVCQNGDQHVRIYLGNNRVAEAQSGVSSGNSRFGHIAKGGCKGYTIYRAIK